MTRQYFNVLLLTSTANALLGFLVWWRNRSNPINIYFAAFAASVAAWTVSNGLVSSYAGTASGVVWAREAFVSASLIPLSFLLFVSVFPSRHPQVPRVARNVFIVLGCAAAIASGTSLVAQRTDLIAGSLKVKYGPLHPYFAAYFVLCLGYGLTVLAWKVRVLSGIQAVQVRYVLLAVGAAGIGATTTNLLIPLVFGSSRFSSSGPLFAAVALLPSLQLTGFKSRLPPLRQRE